MPDPENKKPSRPAESFVLKIVTDPANPPDLIRLAGYKGASSEANSTRLYLNPELNAYADIQEADIVHEEPVPTSADPLGAVVVWVKRDAKLNTRSTQQTAQQAQPAAAAALAGAAPQPAGFTLTLAPSPPPLFCIAPTILPAQCHTPAPLFCTIHSPNVIFCGAPSPPPLFCITPTEICTVRPSYPGFCTIPPVSLLCTVVASPNCPTQATLPTITQPTTQPTTIATTQGQPAAFAAQAAAAPQAGAQPLLYPSFAGICPASQQFICPTPSALFQCPSQHPTFCTVGPSPHILLCNTVPSPHIGLCTTVPSPDAVHCTIQTPPTPQTLATGPQCAATIPPVTGGQTGIQHFAAQAAAPQAAPQVAFPTVPFPTTTVWPSHVLYLCTFTLTQPPFCVHQTPFCTPVTRTPPTFPF